jgi:hypothetical protein
LELLPAQFVLQLRCLGEGPRFAGAVAVVVVVDRLLDLVVSVRRVQQFSLVHAGVLQTQLLAQRALGFGAEVLTVMEEVATPLVGIT